MARLARVVAPGRPHHLPAGRQEQRPSPLGKQSCIDPPAAGRLDGIGNQHDYGNGSSLSASLGDGTNHWSCLGRPPVGGGRNAPRPLNLLLPMSSPPPPCAAGGSVWAARPRLLGWDPCRLERQVNKFAWLWEPTTSGKTSSPAG